MPRPRHEAEERRDRRADNGVASAMRGLPRRRLAVAAPPARAGAARHRARASRLTSNEKRLAITLEAEGLPIPVDCRYSRDGNSIAAMFFIGRTEYTIEGCGESEDARVADVVRQFRGL